MKHTSVGWEPTWSLCIVTKGRIPGKINANLTSRTILSVMSTNVLRDQEEAALNELELTVVNLHL